MNTEEKEYAATRPEYTMCNNCLVGYTQDNLTVLDGMVMCKECAEDLELRSSKHNLNILFFITLSLILILILFSIHIINTGLL